jgi:hypothetical protein
VDSFNYTASDGVYSNGVGTIKIYVVKPLSLTTSCDPFGTAIQLTWILDTNEYNMWQEEQMSIQDIILARSTSPDGPFTNIYIQTDIGETNVYYDTNDIVTNLDYYYTVKFQSSESYRCPLKFGKWSAKCGKLFVRPHVLKSKSANTATVHTPAPSMNIAGHSFRLTVFSIYTMTRKDDGGIC